MASIQTDLEIDLDTLQIRKGGKPIAFTPTESALLRVLIQHKNQTLSYKFLLQNVWGEVYGSEKNYLYDLTPLQRTVGMSGASELLEFSGAEIAQG